MSTLRAAAQEALEALELMQTDVHWELHSPTRKHLRKVEKTLRAALAQEEQDGWVLVPVKPTPAMVRAGGHANSEWLNDNAPIGESRYAMPMGSVWADMLAAAPQLGGQDE